LKRLPFALLTALVFCVSASCQAQAQGQVMPTTHPTQQQDHQTLDQWLMRLHKASRGRAYIGTFVVTTGQYMSSSRIWHVCDGQQQMERVDALTGEPRTTFRRNDQVITFLPASRVAIRERRESLGLFPELLSQADSSLAQYYRLKRIGRERVAGLEADVAQLLPVDALRFGYRIWTEQKTGLVIKLQTLDSAETVLEQAAFSELQLDAPVIMTKLNTQMNATQGYRLRTTEMVETTASQEGWLQTTTVAGFKSMSCNKRSDGSLPGRPNGALQCVFSDGLASVSLFIEPFDPVRHLPAQQQTPLAMGATHVLMRQIGDWWLTAVGEVPVSTLILFARGLERKK
jgi:sigma-E factor negative regulatory protein RseB